ncbi:hypothetical protein L7F22_021619 [Adiantum nelumboides]|nr:hypothetical protein [Adiantum nelumboides]
MRAKGIAAGDEVVRGGFGRSEDGMSLLVAALARFISLFLCRSEIGLIREHPHFEPHEVFRTLRSSSPGSALTQAGLISSLGLPPSLVLASILPYWPPSEPPPPSPLWPSCMLSLTSIFEKASGRHPLM